MGKSNLLLTWILHFFFAAKWLTKFALEQQISNKIFTTSQLDLRWRIQINKEFI